MIKNLKKFLLMGTLVLSVFFVMESTTYAKEINKTKEEEHTFNMSNFVEGIMNGIENLFKVQFNVKAEEIETIKDFHEGAAKGILGGIDVVKKVIDETNKDINNVKDFTEEDISNKDEILFKALLKLRQSLTKLMTQITNLVKEIDTILEKMNVNPNDIIIEEIEDDNVVLNDKISEEDMEKIKEFMSKNFKLIKRGPCLIPRRDLIRPFH